MKHPQRDPLGGLAGLAVGLATILITVLAIWILMNIRIVEV